MNLQNEFILLTFLRMKLSPYFHKLKNLGVYLVRSNVKYKVRINKLSYIVLIMTDWNTKGILHKLYFAFDFL